MSKFPGQTLYFNVEDFGDCKGLLIQPTRINLMLSDDIGRSY
jgi:hypothetical protein